VTMAHWTKDRCSEAIASWVVDHGQIPTRRELDGDLNLPPCHALRRHWGSSTAAFQALGYEPWLPGRRRSTDQYWTTERIVESVRGWIDTHDGELPRSVDFSTSDVLPPWGSIRRRLGSMRALWRAVGVVPPVVGLRRGFAMRGERIGRNRQMVEGKSLSDARPGTVKHFRQ
jgi:hypothetical protein